jgi:hypothetical protein
MEPITNDEQYHQALRQLDLFSDENNWVRKKLEKQIRKYERRKRYSDKKRGLGMDHLEDLKK